MMFCGLIEFLNENDTTWSATQVGLRRVGSGLGGHDEGVFGVDNWVEDATLPLRKRGRTARSDVPAFSDLRGVENEVCSEKQNRKKR